MSERGWRIEKDATYADAPAALLCFQRPTLGDEEEGKTTMTTSTREDDYDGAKGGPLFVDRNNAVREIIVMVVVINVNDDDDDDDENEDDGDDDDDDDDDSDGNGDGDGSDGNGDGGGKLEVESRRQRWQHWLMLRGEVVHWRTNWQAVPAYQAEPA
uniref:Uncharacterized protein n=1 Tax=Vespula pensylvanica TaxID=30213 RepID=A0A834N309_VESPE|nr:hypothetical protein H0235_017372 [Vespula pensylvanica]